MTPQEEKEEENKAEDSPSTEDHEIKTMKRDLARLRLSEAEKERERIVGLQKEQKPEEKEKPEKETPKGEKRLKQAAKISFEKRRPRKKRKTPAKKKEKEVPVKKPEPTSPKKEKKKPDKEKQRLLSEKKHIQEELASLREKEREVNKRIQQLEREKQRVEGKEEKEQLIEEQKKQKEKQRGLQKKATEKQKKLKEINGQKPAAAPTQPAVPTPPDAPVAPGEEKPRMRAIGKGPERKWPELREEKPAPEPAPEPEPEPETKSEPAPQAEPAPKPEPEAKPEPEPETKAEQQPAPKQKPTRPEPKEEAPDAAQEKETRKEKEPARKKLQREEIEKAKERLRTLSEAREKRKEEKEVEERKSLKKRWTETEERRKPTTPAQAPGPTRTPTPTQALGQTSTPVTPEGPASTRREQPKYPEKPSRRKRNLVRNLIGAAALVSIILVGVFAYWFFFVRSETPTRPSPQPVECSSYTSEEACKEAECFWYGNACQKEKPEIEECSAYKNQENCTREGCFWYGNACHKKKEVEEPSPTLIPIEGTKTREITSNEEIEQAFKEALTEGITQNEIYRLALKNTTEQTYVKLPEFLEAFEATVPEELKQALEGRTTLFLYDNGTGVRFGTIVEIENGENVYLQMRKWEETLENDLDKLLSTLGKEGKAGTNVFSVTNYKEVYFRYLSFPLNDFGICWTVYKGRFVMTTSGSSMTKIIDILKEQNI